MEDQFIELKTQRQTIRLKAQGNPQRAREIVDLVSRKLLQVETGKGSVLPPEQVALLALLGMAEEYLASKDRVRDYQSTIAEKADAIFKGFASELK